MSEIDYSKLQAYLRQWLRTQPYGCHRNGAHAIASQLINDAAFMDIRLARWLQSPDGSMIARTVVSVVPYPAGEAVSVMTEAIKIAAGRRTAKEVVATV